MALSYAFAGVAVMLAGAGTAGLRPAPRRSTRRFSKLEPERCAQAVIASAVLSQRATFASLVLWGIGVLLGFVGAPERRQAQCHIVATESAIATRTLPRLRAAIARAGQGLIRSSTTTTTSNSW
jgi:hypothetical protein